MKTPHGKPIEKTLYAKIHAKNPVTIPEFRASYFWPYLQGVYFLKKYNVVII